ncbi:uncharacterized protein zgc:193593 [Xyrauchen texanus]|uniref:uncharacterized protein zgc:193593 n=1 Tax=Xyrauchen texanus TaxID=154827 RepID=UPI00224218EF|nr:uncharacterized protein zgc:193593 [Xyrauchen texanus]
MIFGLPRPTSRYIRYLQTSAMQIVTHRAHDLMVPRVAVLLGALGIAMSGYSSRQLTLYHRPSTRFLQWVSRPVIADESLETQPVQASLGLANAAVGYIKKDGQI